MEFVIYQTSAPSKALLGTLTAKYNNIGAVRSGYDSCITEIWSRADYWVLEFDNKIGRLSHSKWDSGIS